MNIPFIDLKTQQSRIRDKIELGWKNVLDHGAFIMGPEIEKLETRLSKWSETSHNISCSSGTDALILALLGLELKPGQGVIVPSFTFAASAEVMPALGALPVFAEVEKNTFNLDPLKLADALETGKKAGVDVAGIIGVGLFGQPANYTAISKFARENNLWLLDDAAQSFGATLHDKPVGKLADVTCTSFFPAKPLGAYGDAGAVFTDDDKIAEIVRSCRVHGMGHNKYENIRIGMTGRMDTLQAVVIDAKLDIFDEELEMRREVANRYERIIGQLVDTPKLMSGASSSWAQYVIKLPDNTDRTSVCDKLKEKKIPTAIYYPVPMHKQLPYEKYPVAHTGLELTMDLCDRVLALPMHAYLSEDQQKYVVAGLELALKCK